MRTETSEVAHSLPPLCLQKACVQVVPNYACVSVDEGPSHIINCPTHKRSPRSEAPVPAPGKKE